MATKKKPAYKKGPARKKAVAPNDPPIIVSGGGGPDPNIGKLPTFISVQLELEGGLGSKTFKGKVDQSKAITGATINFNQAGVAPVKLAGTGPFQISIQFTSD